MQLNETFHTEDRQDTVWMSKMRYGMQITFTLDYSTVRK